MVRVCVAALERPEVWRNKEESARKTLFELNPIPAVLARAVVEATDRELEVHRGGYDADMRFTCVDCGADQLWTPTQQKWYFEVAKGGIWDRPKRCRKCRLIERKRREEARRIHMEGVAAKKAEACRK